MRQVLFGRYSWPFVALGGLVAAACLASTWYINRLQADLARAVRHDAARMDAADELQVQLRRLRFHTVMCAADPTRERRDLALADAGRVGAALDDIRRDITAEDAELFARIERDYAAYKASLGPDGFPPRADTLPDLVRWADAHPVGSLLAPCRDLSDRQQRRMNAGLDRSESQTAWAGGVLVALGLAGALGGLLTGYATARALTRRVAELSVRVQAVQAHLDQDVGAMTVVGPSHFGELDAQLESVVGRVRDVCRRLQDQERDLLRAEQLAAVGRLAAGIAHEVRNPLTGIKFLVEAALRPGNPNPLTDEDLLLIRGEIARMERTIQELLDYARTPPPDRRPHDLRTLVADAVGAARSRAERKPVAVRVELPETPARLSVDRDQVLSALTNLLINAIEAAPPGGEVGVRVTTGPDGAVAAEVTDNGPGIDPAVAGRLFTPFATTKPTGTGLGLTVARRVAVDHGGNLEASNRPEGGARFTLSLPGEPRPTAGDAA